ncbi:EAL domain-containing protein [Petroclostridium sp. X23]|uniref:sensor domain-containing protein n=1 Tax=Petroclostridium sp. X23 TaxID=3045146 RepID=UPI0024ADBE5F|nr:EAL domain-containing protein [Petroclostridium sp. X23]WHH60099.1 EAL domain-containing protein [Petroclostridium sp. X23]
MMKSDETNKNSKEIQDMQLNSQINLLGLPNYNKLIDAVFQAADVGICVTNEKGEFILFNDAYGRIYGYSREELIGEKFTIVVPDEEKQAVMEKHDDFIRGLPEIGREWKVKRKDGKILDVLVTAGLLIDENQKRYKVTTIEDVTDINATRSKLDLISKAMYNSSEGMIFTESDLSKVMDVNEAYVNITGYTLEDLHNEKGNILKNGLNNEQFYINMWKKVEQNGFWKGEIVGRRKNKKVYTALLMIVALKDEKQSVKNYIGILNERTDQKKNEKRVQFLSTHSILTRLPNRNMFEERLKKEVENMQRSSRSIAMLYIDIDRFRHINDSYGFQFGDKFLKVFAGKLRIIFKNEAMLAYFGVDKFGVLLNNVLSEQYVGATAELVRKRMTEPFIIDNNTINISCSIGISLFPQESKTYEELLKNSEEAMAQAKKQGRNVSQFYTQEMNHTIVRRRRIEVELNSFIDRKEAYLVYQPQVDLATGDITGVEALIRWKHPLLGMVSPAEFIPIAEETGTILKIGEWTIKEACKKIREWYEDEINLVVSVNISSYQIKQDNIVDKIMQIVTEAGIKPSSLELELTESAIVVDIEKCIDKILQFKKLGIRVDIDDFGTGYSSLNYLRKLPLYKLKIDKSFIVDFNKDFDSMIVTKTIIDMAHNLRYKVIAEGVETVEQVKFLRDNGCDELQGYFFSKPLLPEDFKKFWFQKPKLNG